MELKELPGDNRHPYLVTFASGVTMKQYGESEFDAMLIASETRDGLLRKQLLEENPRSKEQPHDRVIQIVRDDGAIRTTETTRTTP